MALPATSVEEIPSGFDWRAIAFVAVFLLAWVSLRPFSDLGDARALDLSSGREAATYLCFGALATLCFLQVVATDRLGLRCLMVPSFLSLVAWIGLTCITSQDVATSLKRAALCGFVAIEIGRAHV